MALQNLGSPSSAPQDYADLVYLAAAYPSYSKRIQTNSSYTLALPTTNPAIPGAGLADFTMYLFEVIAGPVQVTITIPGSVLLTTGLAATYTLSPNKTGFFGFRWSAASQSWFALSATTQQ